MRQIDGLPKTVLCGVPQGSILIPPLLLIYINSLGVLELGRNIVMFAVDRTVIYNGYSV